MDRPDRHSGGLPSVVPTSASFEGVVSRSQEGVQEVLQSRGLRMRPGWLASCLSSLAGIVPGFSNMSIDRQAELCFSQILMADFNVTAAGCLPPDCHTLHKTELPGPFVLQVDEVVDIGSPLRERYKERQGGRCLKLSMTDGVQRVYGMEYRLIPALQVLFPAGAKIVVSDVQVRCGLFLLVPEIVDVLGGVVERLEEARQRVVAVVNKPPRGRRTRGGQGEAEPTLAEQAASAAWQLEESESANDVSGTTGVVTPSALGSASHERTAERPSSVSSPRVEGAGLVSRTHSNQSTASDLAPAQVGLPNGRTSNQVQTNSVSGRHAHVTLGPNSMTADRVGNVGEASSNENVQCSDASEVAASSMSSRDRNVGTWLRGAVAGVQEVVNAPDPAPRATPSPSISFRSSRLSLKRPVEVDSRSGVREQEGAELSSTPMSVDELPGSSTQSSCDQPFTYLATLRDALPTKMKGRVKCVIVGVKEFSQTHNGWKLLVHIDDGSLMTEALIKYEALMECLKRSFPGQSDATPDFGGSQRSCTSPGKEEHLEVFLRDFEGVMDVEFEGPGDVATVSKLEQGFENAEAWTLVKRVNRSNLHKYTRQPNVIHLLSP